MPTLAAAEQKLIGRAGLYLTQAGVVFSGPSPVASLADAISEALAACGVGPSDPSAPTDADMGRLPNVRWWKFLDVAELRLLETAGGALVNRGQSQRWADYSITRDIVSFQAYLEGKRKAVRLKWNYGVSPLAAGTVNLNFVRTRSEM